MPTNPPSSDEKNESPSRIRRELLLVEYKTCTDRYENIYKALWQNLSYFSALSAAILAFSSHRLHWALVVTAAGIPFLFWYLVQFWPLDMYGRIVRYRAAQIERTLNHLYFSPIEHVKIDEVEIKIALGHYLPFAPKSPKGDIFERAMGHFGVAAAAATTFFYEGHPGPLYPMPIRIRMHVAFAIFSVAWLSVALYGASLVWNKGISALISP